MTDQSWQGDVSVFAFDIVGYSKRANADQLDIKTTTEDFLEKAGTKAEQIRQREPFAWPFRLVWAVLGERFFAGNNV